MKIFISYAHVDEYIVQQVVHILTEGGHTPWFDQALKVGGDWKQQLQDAIMDSDAFIYALSPESVQSEWCQWEFTKAVSLGKPIIPVLLQSKTSLPDALRNYQYADFTKGPTAQSVARLLGGLQDIQLHIPVSAVSMAFEEPTGIPAQVASIQNFSEVGPIIEKKTPWDKVKNWFSNIGISARRNYWENLICPYCATLLEIDSTPLNATCPSCERELPTAYIRNFEDANPFFFQVFGWTAHGKSVYLNSLRIVLSEMDKIWSGYTYLPVNSFAQENEQSIQNYSRFGVLEPATPPSFGQPSIILLNDMPRWHSRTLVTMDYAGELFSHLDIDLRYLPYLLKVPVTFFFISIPRLKQNKEYRYSHRVDWLLNSYITTLFSNGIDFRQSHNRSIVVIFTLGDVLPQVPDSIRNYLATDTIWSSIISGETTTPKDITHYLQQMAEVSQRIENWMIHDRENIPGGANFVNLTHKYGIEARYSVVSALGREYGYDGNPSIEITPMRVLDPLLWGLELERQLT